MKIDTKMNLRFQYMYRDAGNYKWYGEMIFLIVGKPDLARWETRLKSSLVDGLYFDPVKWNVTDIREEEWDEELDHGWFEFLGIEMTDSPVTTERNWVEWLALTVSQKAAL